MSGSTELVRVGYVESLPARAAHRPAPTLPELLQLVLAKKLILAMILIVCAVVASVVTLLERPMFRASTTIEVQAPGQITGLVAPVTDNQAESFMRTEVQVLESQTLRSRVLKEFANMQRAWLVQPSQMERWARQYGLITKAPPANSGPPPVRLSVHSHEGTHIVELGAESSDPQYAADYVNTLAQQFAILQSESRLESAQQTSTWIAQQIEDTREKLRKSESQLESFSRTAGRVYGTTEQTVDQQRLAQLEIELSKASADRYQKQSSYETTKQNSMEQVPQVADSGVISNYNAKLVDLRREYAELRSQLTPEHYKVQRVDAQIKELEAVVQKERRDVIGRMLNEYNSSIRREQLLRDAYNGQKSIVNEQAGKAVYYDLLKREVESDRKVYDELLEKSKGTNLAVAMTSSTVRIIDRAEAPDSPFSPRPFRNMAAALLTGLVGGIFLIVIGDQMNRSFRSPGESSYHLGVPELGVIPAHKYNLQVKQIRPKNTLSLRALPPADISSVPGWGDAHSTSVVAESVRSAVASILAARTEESLQVIVVTSAGRGEGKSSTTACLGVALAEIGRKVLLIDADMRKPHLHDLFNQSNGWGLSDVLLGNTDMQSLPLQALAKPTGVKGLAILTSGPSTESISNLLHSDRLPELVKRLRDEFDIILIDTPPMSLIADARVIGRVSDAAILVIRSGKTTRDEAMAAKHRLASDHTRVLGTILNDWNPKSRANHAYSAYYDAYR